VQKEWHKKTDDILEKHQAFMEGVKLGEKIKPQYPGMIEVNYADNRSVVAHYSHLLLTVRGDVFCIGIVGIDSGQSQPEEVRVSSEEYHRILNLFKASGLGVTE